MDRLEGDGASTQRGTGRHPRRVVGLDLGARRVGIAVSDPSGRLASPVGVHLQASEEDAALDALAARVVDLGASLVVVGLPVSLKGSETSSAARVRHQARALAERLAPIGIEVVLYDERFTTVLAERALLAAGAPRPKRGSAGRRSLRTERGWRSRSTSGRPASSGRGVRAMADRRGGRLDAAAATLLLQSFLDATTHRLDDAGQATNGS
jgi:putative Holliday junction resolvase